MSCGHPHETECSEVLGHLYEYLDNEMSDANCAKFQQHFTECRRCLEMYGLEQAVKKLVKRCCGSDDVPGDLRAKVMMRIELIRSGEVVPDPEAGNGAAGSTGTQESGTGQTAKGPQAAKGSRATR